MKTIIWSRMWGFLVQESYPSSWSRDENQALRFENEEVAREATKRWDPIVTKEWQFREVPGDLREKVLCEAQNLLESARHDIEYSGGVPLAELVVSYFKTGLDEIRVLEQRVETLNDVQWGLSEFMRGPEYTAAKPVIDRIYNEIAAMKVTAIVAVQEKRAKDKQDGT